MVGGRFLLSVDGGSGSSGSSCQFRWKWWLLTVSVALISGVRGDRLLAVVALAIVVVVEMVYQ